LLNRLIRLNRLVAHQNRNNMRLKNISKNLTAKLTVNRINRLLRLKRFGSVRLIGFGYILPTPRHVIGPRHVNFHLALDIKRTSSSGATCAAYACSSKGFVKYRRNPVQKRLFFDPVSLYHPFPYAHIFSSCSWCCHNRTAREISPQTKGTSSSLS